MAKRHQKDLLADSLSKRSYNQWLFGIVAKRYGLVTRALSFGRDSSWKKGLVSRITACDSPCVIDIASGNGDLALALLRKFPDARVAAADLNPKMFLAAHKRRHPRVAFAVQDMWALGFKTACANIVTGGYALRNAPDLRITLAEVKRVLKTTGTAAFLDFSKPPNALAAAIEYALLKFWGSLWGLLLHGKPEIYGYIAESLRLFPDRPALYSLLAEAGIPVTQSKRFFFGIVELIICRAN
jgi:demethylmenaquinone methyltransferase/2-methoxy-6-polyprenyl-1,4-benzoquinol methylase